MRVDICPSLEKTQKSFFVLKYCPILSITDFMVFIVIDSGFLLLLICRESFSQMNSQK